jgi:hypothetical protein
VQSNRPTKRLDYQLVSRNISDPGLSNFIDLLNQFLRQSKREAYIVTVLFNSFSILVNGRPSSTVNELSDFIFYVGWYISLDRLFDFPFNSHFFDTIFALP